MTNIERFVEAILTPPQGADAKLALHLLDTLGAWYGGTRTEDSFLATKLTAAQPGVAAAGDNALDRVAQRVAIVRNTEIDDIHMQSCTTIGSVVVPVAVTIAQALGKSDASRFAQALASGYEAMARLSLAISGATMLRNGPMRIHMFWIVASVSSLAPCV